MSWQDNSDSETGFIIYREEVSSSQGLEPQALEKIADVGENISSYSDTEVINGTQYRYGVAAKGENGESAITEQTGDPVSPNPPDTSEPPQLFRAVSSSSTAVVVTFSKPMGDSAIDVANYQLEPTLNITGAVFNSKRTDVILTTATQAGISYTLTVTDVSDLAGIVLEPNPSSATFEGTPQADSGPEPADCDELKPGDEVGTTLCALGVDTDSSARVAASGEALPASFSPMGTAPTLNKVDELFIAGLDYFFPGKPTTLLEYTGYHSTLGSWNNPWAIENDGDANDTQTKRAVVAGDVDGDGFEELVAIYLDGSAVMLKRIDDALTEFAPKTLEITQRSGVKDVAAATGDFDGDGVAEVVLALSSDTGTELLFLGSEGDGFAIRSAQSKLLTPQQENSAISIRLESGNIDFDGAFELVVVMNETLDDGSFSGLGFSQFFIYDDATTDFAPLKGGFIEGEDNGLTHKAIVGDTALGDIDGDGRDEIILGGLTEFAADNSCQSYGHLLVALDDAADGLEPIGTIYLDANFNTCEDYRALTVRFVHINTFDLDRDGRAEVQANQFIFEDWFEAAPWTQIHELPESAFVPEEQGVLSNLTTTIVTGDYMGAPGDFSADGSDDLIVFSQGVGELGIYGLEPPHDDFTKLETIQMPDLPSDGPVRAILVPVNVDDDSPILRYDGGSHRLVFTEPIPIAALAAPPCKTGIGQNIDACTTAFGNTESGTVSREDSVSISASTHIGISIEDRTITQSALELKATASATSTKSQGKAYTLEKTVIYTSGPLEDTVIFTTIPYDQYRYTVISHPDPDLIGETVTVSFPRKPIQLSVERSFYNQNIAGVEGGFKIGKGVFSHTPGDPSSYPTTSEKNQLLNKYGSNLENGPQSVGQGSGSVELSLAVGEAVSEGEQLELGYTFEVNVTVGGVLGGFSIGQSEGSSLTITSGKATSYTGVVGNIDAEHFAANLYNFGLFTYVYTHPSGQQFEVVNYWVE